MAQGVELRLGQGLDLLAQGHEGALGGRGMA